MFMGRVMFGPLGGSACTVETACGQAAPTLFARIMGMTSFVFRSPGHMFADSYSFASIRIRPGSLDSDNNVIKRGVGRRIARCMSPMTLLADVRILIRRLLAHESATPRLLQIYVYTRDDGSPQPIVQKGVFLTRPTPPPPPNFFVNFEFHTAIAPALLQL